MEFNVIKQVAYEITDEQMHIFQQILNKTENLLTIKKEYIFSVILVDSKQIHEINRSYRNIDRPTDVITFALLDSEETLDTEEEELGDVFINVEAIHQQAEAYGHSDTREFSFLFTHGLLHLLGYDHMEKEEELEMFQLQDDILNDIVSR